MKQITDNVYVETDFPGCNPTFITTKEGIVMIDTPMRPTDALKWRLNISEKGNVRYYYQAHMLVYFLIHEEKHAYRDKFYRYFLKESQNGDCSPDIFWSTIGLEYEYVVHDKVTVSSFASSRVSC